MRFRKKVRENKRLIAGVVALILALVMILGLLSPFIQALGYGG